MNLKLNTSELFSSKNRVGTKVRFVFNLVGNLIQICIIIATETIHISYQKFVSQKIHYTMLGSNSALSTTLQLGLPPHVQIVIMRNKLKTIQISQDDGQYKNEWHNFSFFSTWKLV